MRPNGNRQPAIKLNKKIRKLENNSKQRTYISKAHWVGEGDEICQILLCGLHEVERHKFELDETLTASVLSKSAQTDLDLC